MKQVLLLVMGVLLLIALAGVFKFNYLSGQPGYDVDGNRVSPPPRAP